MLKYTKIFIILILIFLNAGCSVHTFASISDCDLIKDESKRDKCFAMLIEEIPSNNTDLRSEICDKLVDAELRDACFFKTAQDGWRYMPSQTLTGLCFSISGSPLRESCENIIKRAHLRIMR